MRTKSLWKKLGRFKNIQDEQGRIHFYSRVKPSGSDRVVIASNHNDEYCHAMPCYIFPNGEVKVVFHAKTIKSLVEFLEAK